MTSIKPYYHLAPIYDQWISGDCTSNSFIGLYYNITKKLDKSVEIIELGIGTGRISIEISKHQKRKIVGIDNCRYMLEECENNIKKNKLSKYFTLKHDDIMGFILPKKALFVMMPFRTIGHFLSLHDKQKTFKNIYNNMADGGVFVFDHYILDESWARENNNKLIKMFSDENMIIYDSYTFDYDNQILVCEVYKKTHSNTIELVTSFEYSWIAPIQMEKLLISVGFKIKNSYGDFNFNMLGEDSEQQIWIVEK